MLLYYLCVTCLLYVYECSECDVSSFVVCPNKRHCGHVYQAYILSRLSPPSPPGGLQSWVGCECSQRRLEIGGGRGGPGPDLTRGPQCRLGVLSSHVLECLVQHSRFYCNKKLSCKSVSCQSPFSKFNVSVGIHKAVNNSFRGV